MGFIVDDDMTRVTCSAKHVRCVKYIIRRDKIPPDMRGLDVPTIPAGVEHIHVESIAPAEIGYERDSIAVWISENNKEKTTCWRSYTMTGNVTHHALIRPSPTDYWTRMTYMEIMWPRTYDVRVEHLAPNLECLIVTVPLILIGYIPSNMFRELLPAAKSLRRILIIYEAYYEVSLLSAAQHDRFTTRSDFKCITAGGAEAAVEEVMKQVSENASSNQGAVRAAHKPLKEIYAMMPWSNGPPREKLRYGRPAYCHMAVLIEY